MVNALSNATPTQAAAESAPVNPKAPASKPQAAITDTFTKSTAGQTAAQEAVETPAQTAIEASKGDPQAQRLATKEAVAKAAYEKKL